MCPGHWPRVLGHLHGLLPGRHGRPARLPAGPVAPPQVDEQQVWDKLERLKKTKSTFPIDLPEEIRKEFSVELTTPLVDIFNSSLVQGVFPRIWKKEMVSPVPKKEYLKEIKDTRKITCLSDYCKLYESFLKTWILEDISENKSFSQFGGKKGVGAEHMLVCMVDRILKLLDTPEGHALVISTQYDWSNAYDRQDPTKTVQKFILMGVRPSLVPVLIDFLSDRSMQIKFNGKTAGPFEPVGGPRKEESLEEFPTQQKVMTTPRQLRLMMRTNISTWMT